MTDELAERANLKYIIFPTFTGPHGDSSYAYNGVQRRTTAYNVVQRRTTSYNVRTYVCTYVRTYVRTYART